MSKVTHLTAIGLDNSNTTQPDTNGELRYVNGTGFRFYQEGTAYTFVTSSGSGVAGSLDAAYSIGREVSLDEGAMVLNDATASTANTLEFSKTGAGTGNLIDMTSDTTFTGNFIDIDMDAAVGAKAIYIDGGGGTRTAALIDLKHDGAGNNNALVITGTATGSGSFLELLANADGAEDGVINIDMNAAVSAEAIYIDAGAGTRDANLIEIKEDGNGNVDVISIVDTNTGSGSIIDINMDGNGGGSVIDVDMNAALGEEFLLLDAGAKTRTANLFQLNYDGAGAVDLFEIAATDTSSGHIFDINMDGIHTGDVFNVDMNAAVGAEFIYLDAGAGTRTVNLIEIKNDGNGNVDALSIVDSNTGSGAVIDINMDGNGGGSVIDVDMNAAVGEEFLILDAGAGTRTVNLFEITNDGAGNVDLFAITDTNTGSGSLFDIDMGGNGGGSVFDVDMNAAIDEEFIKLDAGAGTRTADLISVTNDGAGNVAFLNITDTNTGSGSVIDLSMDGNGGGSTIACDMNAAVGEEFLYLDAGAGTRTVDLIDINFDGNGDVGILDATVTNTGAGNLIELDIDSVHTGAAFLVNYGTGAATGDCVSLTMGTNVAGRAVMINSAATGTANEGAAIDITHSGDLAAGADVMNITSTGNISSTSNLLAIEQSTGAGTAGAYGLYINCAGTNVEAIKVDAGAVVIDESLTVGTTLGVTGVATLGNGAILGTHTYKDLTEVVAATNTIGANESGSVFFLNHATEFVSTLPAEAAGLHFTFIIGAAPSGADYTVVTHDGGDTIHGHAVSSADAGGSADSTGGTGADTVTFVGGQAAIGDIAEFWCDGTNWHVRATMGDEDAITFTAT